MFLLFSVFLAVIAAGCFAGQFFLRIRTLRSGSQAAAPVNVPNRYKPMVRLLSSEDVSLAETNPALRKTFRAERVKLFRRYLGCLTRDYGSLLQGIRNAMVLSGTDRPELTRALAKNRIHFALAICRIEYRLAIYRLGLGTVEISGLVKAFDTLREQTAAFTNAALPITQ